MDIAAKYFDALVSGRLRRGFVTNKGSISETKFFSLAAQSDSTRLIEKGAIASPCADGRKGERKKAEPPHLRDPPQE